MSKIAFYLVALALVCSFAPDASEAVAEETPISRANKAALDIIAGTLGVTPEPYFAKGQLVGCTLVFTAIQKDQVYSQGEFLKVEGNVGVMVYDGNLGTTLKVVVNKINRAVSGLELTPSAPSRAYLISNKLSTNLDSFVSAPESDTPGALFSVFQSIPTLEFLAESVVTNRLTVAFNQKKGRSDIHVDLELDVASMEADGRRIRSPKPLAEFVECLSSLTGKLPADQ